MILQRGDRQDPAGETSSHSGFFFLSSIIFILDVIFCDYWLSFLKKGQLIAGNTKAWLMTNSRKELSFSGHTHSGYALTNHTHSNYALTSHTHSGYASKNHTHSQYVTEVDINQMIEDVIDSYVPTITKLGQVGEVGPIAKGETGTFTVSSSAKVVFIHMSSLNALTRIFILFKLNNSWTHDSLGHVARDNIYVYGSGSTISIKIGNNVDDYDNVYYVYF